MNNSLIFRYLAAACKARMILQQFFLGISNQSHIKTVMEQS